MYKVHNEINYTIEGKSVITHSDSIGEWVVVLVLESFHSLSLSLSLFYMQCWPLYGSLVLFFKQIH